MKPDLGFLGPLAVSLRNPRFLSLEKFGISLDSLVII